MKTKILSRYFGAAQRQKGVATLLIALGFVVAMSIISMTATRTGRLEQQIVSNDVRAREVQEAAEAGLEYGVAAVLKSNVQWPAVADDVTPQKVTCPGGAGCPALSDITGSTSQSAYSITKLEYYRKNRTVDYIRVTATAKNVADNSESTSVTYIKPGSILTTKMNNDPVPFVVKGCFNGVAGQPKTYTDGNATLVTNQSISATDGTDPCAERDPKHLTASTTPFAKQESFDSAWNYTFKISLAQAKASATVSNGCGAPPSGGAIYVIQCDNAFHTSMGSETSPVIIIFPTGYCPKTNGGGGMTIYGFVYYEDPLCGDNNGWGGFNIYGGVILEGPLTKLSANSEHWASGAGVGTPDPVKYLTPIDVSKIPGTWKDF